MTDSVKLIQKEWHQVCVISEVVIGVDDLREIYPDSTDEELQDMLVRLKNEELEPDKVVADANDIDLTFDWEMVDEDWWTMHKGGYDVTYEVEEIEE